MDRHTIAQVLAAWAVAGDTVLTAPGVAAHHLLEAQQALGHPLPGQLSELYRATDGVTFAGGRLELFPLLGSDDALGAIEAADHYRAWDWPLPTELLVVGQHSGGSLIGVWTPRGARRALVVGVGESLDEPALAVLGTSLASFLAAWTAYHLPAGAGETAEVSACLDRLGVPEALREGESDFDEEHLHALLEWASPDLPDGEPDPYARPVPTATLTALSTA